MTTTRKETATLAPRSRVLIETLRRQRALYATLREMSGEQRSHVAGNDPTALLSLLGRRQQVIESLARVDEFLSQFRQDWPAVYDGLDSEAQRQVDVLLEEINETLTSIMAMDREDAETLGQRKKHMATNLRESPKRRQAHAAYSAGSAPRSRYLDHTERSE